MKITGMELHKELLEIASRIEAGDSFEGRIAYTALADVDGLEPGRYEVDAAYRIGNRDGQGGLCVLEPTPTPESQPNTLEERLQHFLGAIEQAHGLLRDALMKVAIDGFNPQIAFALGESGGALSKTASLLQRDLGDVKYDLGGR